MLPLIPSPSRIAALVAFAVALFCFGWVKGLHHEELKFEAYKQASDKAVLAQVQKAAQATADLKIDAAAQQEVLDEKLVAIQHRHDAALVVLRERPERRPDNPGNPGAQPAIDGRGLDRESAGFPIGEAAAAAIQQAERNACISEYAKVKATLDAMREQAKKAAQ